MCMNSSKVSSFIFLFYIDAHPQSQITRVGWLNNNTLVSAGQDSNIKIWDITY